MSYTNLQALIGAAIVDQQFCQQLLWCPQEAARSFNLSSEEQAAVGAIRAENLSQFAAQLHEWLCRQMRPGPALAARPRFRGAALQRQAG